jgi:hypothetical protein
MATPALLPLADALRAVQHVRVRLLPHPPTANLPLHGHLTRGSRQPRMNHFWEQPAIGLFFQLWPRDNFTDTLQTLLAGSVGDPRSEMRDKHPGSNF